MNYSRTLSLAAIGVALLITVPPKLRDFRRAPVMVDHNLEQALAALLEREGFRITTENRFGWFEMSADRDSCHLQVREAAARGYNLDVIVARAPKDAQLIFAYRGKLWSKHPTIRATLAEFWNRLKWRFGADHSWTPVVAIAAAGPCAVETLPWDDVASVRAD